MIDEVTRLPDDVRPRVFQVLSDAVLALERAHAKPPDRFVQTGRYIVQVPADSPSAIHNALHQRVLPTMLLTLEALVEILGDTATRDAWTAQQLKAHFDACFEQFTAYLFQRFPLEQETLTEFRRDILQAARAAPWWDAYDEKVSRRGLSAGVDRPESVVTATTLRDALKESGWGVDELAEEVGLDRTSVQDHLAKKSVPRSKQQRRYTEVLSKKLGRAMTLDFARVNNRNAAETPLKPR